MKEIKSIMIRSIISSLTLSLICFIIIFYKGPSPSLILRFIYCVSLSILIIIRYEFFFIELGKMNSLEKPIKPFLIMLFYILFSLLFSLIFKLFAEIVGLEIVRDMWKKIHSTSIFNIIYFSFISGLMVTLSKKCMEIGNIICGSILLVLISSPQIFTLSFMYIPAFVLSNADFNLIDVLIIFLIITLSNILGAMIINVIFYLLNKKIKQL